MEIIYRHFDTLPSTNDWAKAHLSSFKPDALTVIVADTQTAGKGRYGRRWMSPAGVNLYATFVFFIDNPEPLLLTHLLALTLTDLLPCKCQIKWPNDILVNGKKIAGILCETISPSGIILGFGLNVNMTHEELLKIDQPATSLLAETKKVLALEPLLHRIAGQFVKDLTLYLERGFTPFTTEFQRRLTGAKRPC